ncbi:galactokinase [Candidatus Thorarchaeota archaeon]|nr:MAG: galactokinase [Candidatus Thorarchaeota archaeon]
MNLVIPEILFDAFHDIVEDQKESIFGARAPGRIEIIGNHTDYNGGLVLASTLDRFIWVVGTTSDDTKLHSIEFNNTIRFDPNNPIFINEVGWSNYARGVYWAFKRRNHDVKGLTGAIHGNIPLGGGLSSSAALQVALVNIISCLNNLKILPKSQAMLAFESERVFCGIACGVMDQFTSQLGKPNSLLGIHCGNLMTQDIAIPEGVSFIVVNSMVSRDSSTILHERKNESLQALKILQEAGWDIPNLSAITAAEVFKISESLDEKMSRRVRHVVNENQRVREGITLLQQNQIEEFGRLMIQSHGSSRDLYEVSHPNLEILMGISQNLDGVLGCRLSGAGAGGNLLMLTKTKDADRAATEMTKIYEKETGLLADTSICAIPGGVIVEEFTQL